MKTYILAAVVAVATLGFVGTASAQVGYNYRSYNPYTGSFINGRMYYTPFGVQNVQAFNNPWWGYGGQSLAYQDPFGNTYGQVTKYNPFTGLGYTSGYYNPGLYGNPYLGYRYGFYFR
jgi:hypothetical protein